MGVSNLYKVVSEPIGHAADDLRSAGRWISALAERAQQPEIERPLRELRSAAERVGQAWCGSWLSGLSHLYETGLQSLPAPVVQASMVDGGSATRCSEWSSGAIHRIVHDLSGRPDTARLSDIGRQAAGDFDDARICVAALLGRIASQRDAAPRLAPLLAELTAIRPASAQATVEAWRPKVTVVGRAERPSQSERAVPPHIAELAWVESLRSPFEAAARLADLVQRAADCVEALHKPGEALERPSAVSFAAADEGAPCERGQWTPTTSVSPRTSMTPCCTEHPRSTPS